MMAAMKSVWALGKYKICSPSPRPEPNISPEPKPIIDWNGWYARSWRWSSMCPHAAAEGGLREEEEHHPRRDRHVRQEPDREAPHLAALLLQRVGEPEDQHQLGGL